VGRVVCPVWPEVAGLPLALPNANAIGYAASAVTRLC